MKEIPDHNQVQFQLLTRIDQILRAAHIDYWLRGGWALDFLLGRITRPHSDIDLVILRPDAEQVRELLTTAGFTFHRDTGLQFDFHHSDQKISVSFVDGRAEKPFVDGIPDWVWVADALLYPPQRLNGLTCRVLSPGQLLEEKEGYEPGTGTPPREKDLHSIAILRRLLDK